MRGIVSVTVAIIGLAFAGCGGDDDGAGSQGPVPEPVENKTSYSAQQVVDALQLTKDPNASDEFATGEPGEGLWDARTQCTIAVVMTTPSQVALYADAGDQVASNPSRTAGVKFTVYQGADVSACYRVFTRRLATLK